MTKKELLEIVMQKENMYFDLIWYARADPSRKDIPEIALNISRIQKEYPEECKKLATDETRYWQHGFNSGMLAGMRYVLSLVEFDKEFADENFPELDS